MGKKCHYFQNGAINVAFHRMRRQSQLRSNQFLFFVLLIIFSTAVINNANCSPDRVSRPNLVNPSLSELLLHLDSDKQSVVYHDSGPLLVLSGPGTGKSHAIAARITCLIVQKNIPPNEILALAFTEKAANLMQVHFRGLLPKKSNSTHRHSLYL